MHILYDEFLRGPLNRAPTCKHDWCLDCLKGRFEAAITDRTLWPPACCNNHEFLGVDILALNLLDSSQYAKFMAKSEEYGAKDPLYCPKKTCSAFIPRRGGRHRKTVCRECKTTVCTKCKQIWHPSKVPCTKDNEAQSFDELVETEMWASCPQCNQTIELTQGCNHMVCM